MFLRRSHRSAPRTSSLALGGALAVLAVVGGGAVVAVSAPTEVSAGEILLAQNAGPQEMALGVPVDLDLEPVVAQAAGGTIPAGTTVQVTGLPDGLTQDGWVISGTPSRAGDYDVLITVSNGGVSKSEKVTITVTGAPGAAAAATTTAAPTTTAAAPAADDETVDGATTEGRGAETPTTRPASDPATTTTTTTAADPTLSAAPGVAALGDADPGDTTGDDDESPAPDLCAVLGDGGVDGASVSQLLPLVLGNEEGASTGLVMVVLNAVLTLLPSVLGESGSTDDLGSAGQILCTLAPSLLGGESSGEAGGGTGATTTGAAGVGGAPAALLGLLTSGTGSAGD
ncbi:hypothetical protein [Dietzia sp. UBA5065]|jgi:hypothetical protein|uniref:hypothetical protein n=1 Tax=Dietzia sp. UBA5065 TaxID=1946422 RepID=UPI0025C370CB|nr:hypothetical protein [Dietzia sp. UBA5065]HMT50293.1 hypothetical protein [Dietzia sp.]